MCAADAKTGYGEQSLTQLAQRFENRRQYEKAVTYWQQSDGGKWEKKA